MKHYTLIFAACLCIAIVAVPQPKTKAVPVDEVELMLEKISSHLQEASVATAQAHKMSDKMVEEKVAEKAELNTPQFWYIVFDESLTPILGTPTEFEVVTPPFP